MQVMGEGSHVRNVGKEEATPLASGFIPLLVAQILRDTRE